MAAQDKDLATTRHLSEIDIPVFPPSSGLLLDQQVSLASAADMLKEPLDAFSPAREDALREMAEARCAPFRENCALVFQNQALLASAVK